jgi:S-formylglutathione hydrolase
MTGGYANGRHRSDRIGRMIRLSWLLIWVLPAWGGKLVTGTLSTTLIPHPLAYTVLLPDGYDPAGPALPLLLALHGGDGDRGFLSHQQPYIEQMWSTGKLPKMVVATPDAERSFYMDRKDGSQKWETVILFALVDHLREQYKVSRDRSGLFMYGISMGGMGALRMGLKHPERVGAVVGLEPGIDPALKWTDVKPTYRFWRSDALMESVFGKPLDEAYWEANNPANMAISNAAKIRDSGLGIYVDAGDEDMFHLEEAAEFLHRILYDHGIPHEYHLVHGADHLGASLPPRIQDGLGFLNRMMNPWKPTPLVTSTRKILEQQEKNYRSKY